MSRGYDGVRRHRTKRPWSLRGEGRRRESAKSKRRLLGLVHEMSAGAVQQLRQLVLKTVPWATRRQLRRGAFGQRLLASEHR